MKMFLFRKLLWLLEGSIGMLYTEIDDQARKEWLIRNHREAGFVSYFKWRDLTLLKILGTGQESKAYWITVGQRIELLNLAGLMKDEFDRTERGSKKERADEKKA